LKDEHGRGWKDKSINRNLGPEYNVGDRNVYDCIVNINRWLDWIFCNKPVNNKPGPIYVILKEKDMASIFRVEVAFPVLTDADVVSREFAYKVGEDAEVVTVYDKDVPSVELRLPQNATVALRLVDIDDAGNRSEPSERTFTAVDTVPPAKPGELNVTVLEEEHTP